jgi:cell division transport system permease protein
MLLTLKRIFFSGWRNFIRDGGPSIATIFVILIPVALISSLLIFKEANRVLISSLQEKADISVYFKEEAKEEEILYLKDELAKIPEVKEVKYISKEEAFQNFIQRHGQNPILMEALREVGKNPFFSSLNIKAWQANQYETILKFFENSNFKDSIEKIDYSERKPLIEKIFSLTSNINKVGITLFVLMSILALLITFNTIRLSIIKQREEIRIQKLVGASNWFIRGPFFVQGAISGILSAIICLLLFGLLFYFLDPRLKNFFPEFPLFSYFKEKIFVLFLTQLLIGITIGTISSLLAIRKYLEV